MRYNTEHVARFRKVFASGMLIGAFCIYAGCCTVSPNFRPLAYLILKSFPGSRLISTATYTIPSFHFLSFSLLYTINFQCKIAYCCIYHSFMLYGHLLLFFPSLHYNETLQSKDYNETMKLFEANDILGQQ